LNLSYQQQGPRAGGSGGIWVGKRDAVRDVFDHDQDVFSERSEVMRVLMTVIVSLTLAPVALAHDLFIFPSNGQSQDQQDQDEFQCMRAATRQSGFDPMQTPTAATRPPETQGGVGQGALRGALLGTAVGAATGNTRQGARAGACAGQTAMRSRTSGRGSRSQITSVIAITGTGHLQPAWKAVATRSVRG
jgi:hypothetical protein